GGPPMNADKDVSASSSSTIILDAFKLLPRLTEFLESSFPIGIIRVICRSNASVLSGDTASSAVGWAVGSDDLAALVAPRGGVPCGGVGGVPKPLPDGQHPSDRRGARYRSALRRQLQRRLVPDQRGQLRRDVVPGGRSIRAAAEAGLLRRQG